VRCLEWGDHKQRAVQVDGGQPAFDGTHDERDCTVERRRVRCPRLISCFVLLCACALTSAHL
jgi:hypothetical protein